MTRIVIDQIQGFPGLTPAAAGKVLRYDVNNGVTWSVLPKSVTLTDPFAGENLTLFYTPAQLTITELRSHVSGITSPSVQWSLRFAQNRTNTGLEVVNGGITCTNTTNGHITDSFSNPTIPPGSWVWLTTGLVSGNPSLFHVTIIF